MKILSIGTDHNILNIDSPVAQRAVLISQLVDQYDVLVPGKNQVLDLAINSQVIGVGGANKLSKLFSLYQKANNLLSTNQYDLITVQDTYYLAYMAYHLAKKFQTKLEVQVHGLEKFYGLRKILAQQVCQQADSIRTVSVRLKNYLVHNFKIAPEKITVVPVFVDLATLKNSPLDIDLKQKYPQQFIFLFVGRLVAVKNIPLILRALSKLDQSLAFKFVIVGDGPAKNTLINLVQELHLQTKVEFVGWVKNLSSFYKTADCLILASDSEGRGMVVEEAVACGLPVVMTDVGLAGELVKNKINGLVVPIGDLLALSTALTQVLTNADELAKWRQYNLALPVVSSQDLIKDIVANWQNIITVAKQ